MTEWKPDGTFILSVLGVVSACFSGLLVYFIKSRCTVLKCCCIHIERDTIPASVIQSQDLGHSQDMGHSQDRV